MYNCTLYKNNRVWSKMYINIKKKYKTRRQIAVLNMILEFLSIQLENNMRILNKMFIDEFLKYICSRI